MQCRHLSLFVADKAGDVFGLAFRRLVTLQKAGKIRTRVATLKASRAEQLVKIDALESHEHEIPDKIRGLGLQFGTVRVGKEHHEPQEVKRTKAVTNVNFESANAKRPFVCLRVGPPGIGRLCHRGACTCAKRGEDDVLKASSCE